MADETTGSDDTPGAEVTLDIHRPHSARMYDYFLGGTTNFEPDRTAAAQTLAVFPNAPVAARANRAFMRRTTRMLARHGITQFLDIGTGIPTSPNLHEVAQQVNPSCRVVYADNDPIVLTHARALLRSTPEGRTAYIQADVRDPEHVLDAVKMTGVIDLDRPVALSMNALLHFVSDGDGAYEIAEVFKRRLRAPGSALVLSHITPDFAPEETARGVRAYRASGTYVQTRAQAEFARFFEGWKLADPGIVSTPRWRPDAESARIEVTDAQASCYGAVAFRP
ncbi:SAM-dependent methyltransferase [Kitasatospora sp. NPDC092948]|uniref:SAM-dependent methyltransferase n=1 Tax=Kitasatospora sp. NPDC092948 TaxID=3364088 RepID=UPI003809AE31